MSGDLLTLRMMVVSAVQADRDLWGQAAALASVPIEFVGTGAGSALRALKRSPDILILDADLPTHAALIDAARAVKPMPLIAVAVSATSTGIENADSVFLKPANLKDAAALVERCVRLRLPKRVLIVDDSPTMRSIVRKILSASRFPLEVSETKEGVGALEKVANGYDLVLLDYNMPGFNGIETLAEIKRISPNVAVVIMTSTEDDTVARLAQASGAVAFLKKPFYPADIDTVLARIVDKGPTR